MEQLRETVNALTEGAGNPSLEAPLECLVDDWRAATTKLYNRIANIYLIEFLISGQMRIEFKRSKILQYPVGYLDVDVMIVTVGKRTITIKPECWMNADCQSVVVMSTDKKDIHIDFVRPAKAADGQWMVIPKKQGLRTLLKKYVRPKSVVLTETSFKEALNSVLLGHEPVFSLEDNSLGEKLEAMVDQLEALDFGTAKWREATANLLPQVRERTLLLGANMKSAAQGKLAHIAETTQPLLGFSGSSSAAGQAPEVSPSPPASA